MAKDNVNEAEQEQDAPKVADYGEKPEQAAEDAEVDPNAGGADQVQEKMDEEQEKGYRGVVADKTPNEHYTVAGVLAGKPTPETAAPDKAEPPLPL